MQPSACSPNDFANEDILEEVYPKFHYNLWSLV
jgi:hypothetical protein